MMEFINYVKSLSKVEQIHIDNKVFKLHYKLTVMMLVIFSLLVTSKQYFGDPIDCYVDDGNLKSIMDTYCWISGTFVLASTVSNKVLPGLGNEADRSMGSSVDDYSQKYYQWVCIFLCFQAMMFYVPCYLWRSWEQGRLRLLVSDFGGPIVSPCWTKDAKEKLVKYILSPRHSHNIYAFRFFFCEILNMLNVIVQIVLTDWFLTGEFGKWNEMFTVPMDFTDPFTFNFPKIAKCTFHFFGPSGDAQMRDALCVLPLNVLNEKLFVFLRFWFYLLLVLTAIAVFWRLIVMNSLSLCTYLLMYQCNIKSGKTIGKNMNEIMYEDLVDELIVTAQDKRYNPEITMPL